MTSRWSTSWRPTRRRTPWECTATRADPRRCPRGGGCSTSSGETPVAEELVGEPRLPVLDPLPDPAETGHLGQQPVELLGGVEQVVEVRCHGPEGPQHRKDVALELQHQLRKMVDEPDQRVDLLRRG